MKITSPAFEHNRPIPRKYSCDGESLSPPLEIDGIPDNAASLALTLEDPDAGGGGFLHWIVWNISPGCMIIKEGKVPEDAVEGKNDSGLTGYAPPCPPAASDPHRYYFTLYALSNVLELPDDTSISELKTAMEGMIIEKAELIGLYER